MRGLLASHFAPGIWPRSATLAPRPGCGDIRKHLASSDHAVRTWMRVRFPARPHATHSTPRGSLRGDRRERGCRLDEPELSPPGRADRVPHFGQIVALPGDLSRFPATKLSNPTTCWFSSSKGSSILEPMNPAPPLIDQVCVCGFILSCIAS